MKSTTLLKTLLLPFALLLWQSCAIPEDIISSSEFVPLKTLSISPDSAKVGDAIVITGENFISQKEYNSVWFSPNVKAVIDSATKTQLFLKVPEGAVTGDIVVSNGAYVDTVRGFTITKIINFKKLSKCSYGFDGVKVIKTSDSRSRYDGTIHSGEYRKDTTVLKESYSLIKSEVPDNNTFTAIGNCLYNAGPKADTILQSFDSKSFNGGGTYTYRVCDANIDTTNGIISKLNLSEIVYSIRSSYPRTDRECKIIYISIENVPFTVINGKIYITIKSEFLKDYIKSFKKSYTTSWANSPGGNWGEGSSNSDGIFDVSPDAYFELTLE